MTENFGAGAIKGTGNCRRLDADRVANVFRRPLYPAFKFSKRKQERSFRNSFRKNGSLPNVLEYSSQSNGYIHSLPHSLPQPPAIATEKESLSIPKFHYPSPCSSLSTKLATLQISPEVPLCEQFLLQDSTRSTSILPLLKGLSHPDLQCISPQTIVQLLEGKYSQFYDKVYIIDCRFDYEYKGGHIRGAVNISTTEALMEMFWNNPQMRAQGHRMCLVFHCEYSSHRAPNLCRHLRNLDRTMNRENYPHLFYPEVYLLEGGYRNFFQQYKSYCEPQNYVEMKDPNFTSQMKQAMSHHLKTIRRMRSRSCSELNFPNRQNLTQSLPNIRNFELNVFQS
jgi:rhodanese-related sulfurtransferase